MNRLKKIHQTFDLTLCGWKLLAIAGVVLLSLTYAIFTEIDLCSLRTLSSEALSSASHHLAYYSNESASHQAEILASLADKADCLCKLLREKNSPDLPDREELAEYTKRQHLNGLLIVDDNFQAVCQFDTSALTYDDWSEEVHSPEVSDILRFPQKHYMGHSVKNGTPYDYAAISRTDAPGLILVYRKRRMQEEEVQADALGGLFSNYTLQRGGTILLLKDLSDISRMPESSRMMEQPEADAGDGDEDTTSLFSCDFGHRYHGLLKGKMKGQTWYGDAIRMDGCTICVFFPDSEVFRERSIAMCFLFSFYIIFMLVLLLIRRHLEARNMEQLNRQYRIIEAIGNVYETILMVDLKTNILEPVTAPDYLFADIPYRFPADKILDTWAKKYVAPDYIQKHCDFMDFSTVQERLGANSHIEFKYLLNNGMWCQVMMIPKRYDENHQIEAVLLVTRNITEEMQHELSITRQIQEAADEAKKANAAKTDFLRRMSHDIRTPINGIRGMIEIANHFPEDMEKQNECRKKILQASDFLLDLVNSVLDMNKLESGELILEEVPFSLEEVSHEVAAIIRPQTSEHGLHLSTKALFVRHHYLIGSPLYLRQILLNLAGNAVKYNRPGGSICVSCQEISSDETTATFVFSVEDTGLGMSE